MVSKASEDFPEPLRPVMTVKLLRGISTSMFLRLCWRAPCTLIRSSIICKLSALALEQPATRFHRITWIADSGRPVAGGSLHSHASCHVLAIFDIKGHT